MLFLLLLCTTTLAQLVVMPDVTTGPGNISGVEVQRALNRAIAMGSPFFQLPAGDIICDEDFVVLNASNMEILGATAAGGTTFWFEPSRSGFRVMDSHNVSVRRIVIDHDPLPYIQAEITHVAPIGGGKEVAYNLTLGTRSLDFAALDGRYGPIVQPWLWSGAGADRWVKQRLNAAPALNTLQRISNRTYATLPGFPQMPDARVGDALTYMLRQAHTYVIGNSSNVVTEDVTIYSAKSLNLYELDGEGGHTYRRVKVTRRDGQLIASNADCFHSIDVARGPLVVDSEMSYCLDDFFNVHNTIHILMPAASATSSATLINPRITDCHSRPSSIAPYVNDSVESNATLDQWYGDTSPMSNAIEGVDTLQCHTFNSFQPRFGGAQILKRKRLVNDAARTSYRAAQALMQRVTQATGIRFAMPWCGVELWDVDFNTTGWNTTADPVLMCDVARFGGQGAAIVNSTFHHTTCNLGRMKASGSRVVGSGFSNAGSWNLEIKGLPNWMEGPMLIDNVTVENNTFHGTQDGNRNVHASPQATNVTIRANLPVDPADLPSNISAFCNASDLRPCVKALSGNGTFALKCSANFMHVEQHLLPVTLDVIHLDALHILAEGNTHTDVEVVGVVYSDSDGQPGALLGKTAAVVVAANASQSFVRLPFVHSDGIHLPAYFSGGPVWLGEVAGKLTELSQNPRTEADGDNNANAEAALINYSILIPPGPQDLACIGFATSEVHHACRFRPQTFGAALPADFGVSSVCSTSLSVFATVQT